MPAKKKAEPKTAKQQPAPTRPAKKSGGSILGYLVAFCLGVIAVPGYYYATHQVHREKGRLVLVKKKSASIVVAQNNQETQPEHAKTCARNRWLLKKATMDYYKKVKTNAIPTMFDLIGKGLLKEVPNCPLGGNYSIKKAKNGEISVSCTKH